MQRISAAAALAAAILAAAILALPAGAEPPAPMALRRIMERLGRDMQSIAGAIAREDWALVARTAPRIAHHDQPPALEKARILAFVGANAGRFRAHDEKVHEAAARLAEAAGAKDAAGVIAAYAQVQRGCHGCHAEFRAPFVEHFHGRR